MDLMSEPLNQRVYKEIRAEMARQGVSQAALADALGHNQTYVSYRLTGKTSLTLEEVEDIAHILGVRVDRLFAFEDPLPRRRKDPAQHRRAAS
jgi:transcriptional regulator with XRE-family HTH domain